MEVFGIRLKVHSISPYFNYNGITHYIESMIKLSIHCSNFKHLNILYKIFGFILFIISNTRNRLSAYI